MPSSTKWIGVYGNGALAVFTGLLALASIGKHNFTAVLFGLVVCSLAVFNIRLVRWAMTLNSEEEYLQAEVRKAELRKQLATLGEFAHPSHGERDGTPSAETDQRA